VFETVSFATLPLFAASLLTWFLCIEFPDFSLPAVFTAVYYAYAHVLAKPRVTSDTVNEAVRTLLYYCSSFLLSLLFVISLSVSLSLSLSLSLIHLLLPARLHSLTRHGV
jgi:hypothetical protein